VGTEERLWSGTPGRIPEGRPCLIVRPRDGGGRVGRELPEVVRYLRDNAVRPVVVEARGVGEGGARAREALEAGGRVLVSVGGDGLAREVVAAIMGSPAANEVTLSVLSAGSDCDFVKTFGLPPDAATAVPRLLTGAE
jgi:diacylglycerol kinase family enzyme